MHMGVNPLQAMLEQLQLSLPAVLSNPALRAMAEGFIGSSGLVKIDTGRICDVCNCAIMGDRWASSVQQDFDCCASCMLGPKGAELEAAHKFKKISAFDAILECVSNGGSVDAFFAGGGGAPACAAAAAPEPNNVHHAICDNCSETIVGDRFKSLELADYDLCQKCYPVSENKASFYRIQDPKVRTIPAEVIAEYKNRKAVEEAEKKAKEAEQKAKEAEQLAAKAREEAEKASRMVKPAPIAVKQPEQPKVESPKPEAPKREPSAFESNLQTLESMGFTDRKKCVAALVRNRNSLFATIQELLNSN
jgi:hypothetical protein